MRQKESRIESDKHKMTNTIRTVWVLDLPFNSCGHLNAASSPARSTVAGYAGRACALSGVLGQLARSYYTSLYTAH